MFVCVCMFVYVRVCVCVCMRARIHQNKNGFQACLIAVLTPWSRTLFEELIDLQLAIKLTTFYEIRSFITLLTKAHQLSIS